MYLARHGETPWSLAGQHTGLKDVQLTKHGDHNAPPGYASCPVSNRREKWIAIWSSGTTTMMKASTLSRFSKNVPAGNCFATAASADNRRIKWVLGLTAW